MTKLTNQYMNIYSYKPCPSDMMPFVSAAHYYHLQLDPEHQHLTYIIDQQQNDAGKVTT